MEFKFTALSRQKYNSVSGPGCGLSKSLNASSGSKETCIADIYIDLYKC